MGSSDQTAEPQGGARGRALTLCVIPARLAPRLHELLREHFRDDPGVEVIVERRGQERRSGAERRGDGRLDPEPAERRLLRAAAGRRTGERRRAAAPAVSPKLPRRARRFKHLISFEELGEVPDGLAEELDSARLITRAQGGDPEAASLLYSRYFDRVYGYLRLMLADPAQAEAATQEAFVELFEGLRRYKREQLDFRAWIFSRVCAAARQHLRRRQGGEAIRETAAGSAERADSERLDVPWIISDREMLTAVERLPIAARQALLLRAVLGLTQSETARVLGVDESRVAADYLFAMQALHADAAGARLTAQGRETHGMTRAFADRWGPVTRARRLALHR